MKNSRFTEEQMAGSHRGRGRRECRRPDAVLEAHFAHRRAGFGLLVYGDDLAVGEAGLLRGTSSGSVRENSNSDVLIRPELPQRSSQLRIIAMRPMATTVPMTPDAATAPQVPILGLSQ